MECRNLHSLLNESLERPLSENLQSQVDAHLAGCPACQTDATLLRSMIQAIEEAPEVRPSDDFTLKVMDRLPIPLGGFLGVQTMTLRIVAAATAVMAAGLGWVYQGTLIHNLRQLPVILASGTDTLSPYMADHYQPLRLQGYNHRLSTPGRHRAFLTDSIGPHRGRCRPCDPQDGLWI